MVTQVTERTVDSQLVFRTFGIEHSGINQEERTLEILATTEDIVEDSFYGPIILDHSPGAVRTDRINSGRAPILMDHDSRDVVGVIKNATFSSGYGGRVIARFGKSARAEGVFSDVVDGIRNNVSVGAMPLEGEEITLEDGRTAIRFTKCEPYEVSIVAMGANPAARILHEDGTKFQTIIRSSVEVVDNPDHQSDTNTSQEEITEPVETIEEVTPIMVDTVDNEVIVNAVSNESKRVLEMVELGVAHGCVDKAKEFAKDKNKTPDNLRAWILDNKGTQPTHVSDKLDASAKEMASYSLTRAINLMADPSAPRTGLEFEMSQTLAKRFGTSPKGLFVPSNFLTHDLTTGGAAAGAALVGVDHAASEFIDFLRPRLVVGKAGARTMGGLVGNVRIPRQSGGSTVYWVDETTDITESNIVTDYLELSFKTMGACTDMTRSQRLQTAPSAEGLVKNDILRAIAQEIDRASLEGSGASNQPSGLYGLAGNTVTSGTLDFQDVVDLEGAVATDNADFGSLAYLTTSAVRSILKRTPEHATATRGFVWENADEAGEGLVNGYRAFTTNVFTVPTQLNPVFFGNWNDLIIAQWAGIDVTVDPYSLSKSGGLRVVAFLNMDVGARHVNSFAVLNP